MQMIATVVRRQQARRLAGITRDPVEIDHGVELTAISNPCVHRIAKSLSGWQVVTGPTHRSERRTVSEDAVLVRPRDKLPIAGNEIGGGHRRPIAQGAMPDVVDTKQHDKVLHAGLA